jgi:hypothetical protein
MRLFLALAATAAIPLSLMAAPAFAPMPAEVTTTYELIQKKGKWKGKMKGKKGGGCMCERKCSQKGPRCMPKCLSSCKMD